VKFEKKSKTVDDPALGGNHETDVSELTVQHPGNKPKVLVLGQAGVEEEPVALVRCDVAGSESRISPRTIDPVHRENLQSR